MSSQLKAELAATCSTLGRFHKGKYLIEPECIESVKDLIRYLKRDDEYHEIRRYLGESKVLQNDLIHIIKSCTNENSDLFDVTLRLLINLTTPTMLFFGEEIPTEKIGRNIYLNLLGYAQDYKAAFCDIEFWNKMNGTLCDLFETDWSERSADDGIQIERILMLLRNVLQVPADVESEKKPENDITVHDKVLWALRKSQMLEFLLSVSSNENEEQYYLNLLEIFSLILREQNPITLAKCDMKRSTEEKNKEVEELVKVRESEKKCRNKYTNTRNFHATFVMKGVKSLSNIDVVCHRSLEKVNTLELNSLNKKQMKIRKNKIPIESDRTERRSAFSIRLFLKEFCLEFLNHSFRNLMYVVKNKLDSGKSLANDETYYFWALKFFLDFATASNVELYLIKDFLSSESFHFVQTSLDNAFEHLAIEKKKTAEWVKRIHLILKAYRSLLQVLLWMDSSKNPLTRSISREIKSKIFYVVEYREMTLHILLLYDSTKFSLSFLRDLIETTHLFIKLLEEYSKQSKLVVQTVARKRKTKKKNTQVEEIEITREERWEMIKDDVYDVICCETSFPEIPPFDAALDIPIDDQKGLAMKKIQNFLHKKQIRDAVGLLRTARQVWPENDCFGNETMTVEDETMALQEICCTDLGEVEGFEVEKEQPQPETNEDEESEEEEEDQTEIIEQEFDVMEYKSRLVNKKVVESCGLLLKNYSSNSDHTNHCVIKTLHRIGWECSMPAMLFQASLFWTLLKIMEDKRKNYEEINTFTINLVRRFRKHAEKNPTVFLELLFWKDRNSALEIQHGYEPYEKPKKSKIKSQRRKNKARFNNYEYFEVNRTIEFLDTKDIKARNRKKTERKRQRKKNKDDGSTPVFKSNGNTSKLDFGGSESEKDEEMSDLDKSSDNDLDKTEELSGENKKSTKSNPEITDSSDEEDNSIRKNTSPMNNSKSRKELLDTSDEELKNEEQTQENKSNESQTSNVSPKKQKTHSSDEEDNNIRQTTSPMNNHSKSRKELLDTSDEETNEERTQEKNMEENKSDESQTSNASSKKRKRKTQKRHTGLSSDESDDDSDESENSKLKKIRCIGSDSDPEPYQSQDEDKKDNEKEMKNLGKKGNRRRLAVIDSDSDVENNSVEDK